MLRIQVEMVPFGQEVRARKIAHVEICNVAKDKYIARVADFEGDEGEPFFDPARTVSFKHKEEDDLFVCIGKAVKALLRKEITPRRRIPTSEYYNYDNHPYVIDSLLKKYHSVVEVERFYEWMTGQTVSQVKDEHGNETFGIYCHDYERWWRQGMRTQQGRDWD